jgi:hypothetical protein
MFASLRLFGWINLITDILFGSALVIFAIFLSIRLLRQPRTADAPPMRVLGRGIVIAWAFFIVLIAATLFAAFMFPHAVWLPSPSLLLALSLTLTLFTVAFVIMLVFKAVVSRVKH